MKLPTVIYICLLVLLYGSDIQRDYQSLYEKLLKRKV
jgi:hypothetical protein